MEIKNGLLYLTEVKQLIVAYTESLGRDLTFQNLSEELDNLTAKYGPPNGHLLAAVAEDGTVIGCVAYHRHSPERCEMKRLYVLPEYRKDGTGQALITQILADAKAAGYQEMVLDTLHPMKSAIRLYRKNGFQEIPAYYHNPMSDVIYLGKKL